MSQNNLLGVLLVYQYVQSKSIPWRHLLRLQSLLHALPCGQKLCASQLPTHTPDSYTGATIILRHSATQWPSKTLQWMAPTMSNNSNMSFSFHKNIKNDNYFQHISLLMRSHAKHAGNYTSTAQLVVPTKIMNVQKTQHKIIMFT